MSLLSDAVPGMACQRFELSQPTALREPFLCAEGLDSVSPMRLERVAAANLSVLRRRTSNTFDPRHVDDRGW